MVPISNGLFWNVSDISTFLDSRLLSYFILERFFPHTSVMRLHFVMEVMVSMGNFLMMMNKVYLCAFAKSLLGGISVRKAIRVIFAIQQINPL